MLYAPGLANSQQPPDFIPGRMQLANNNDNGGYPIVQDQAQQSGPFGIPIAQQSSNDNGGYLIVQDQAQQSGPFGIPIAQQSSNENTDSVMISPLSILGLQQPAGGENNTGNVGNAGSALTGRDIVKLILDLLADSLGSPVSKSKA